MNSARGGFIEKRNAVMAGAMTVFARDGYARAGVDGIAEQAGVSTRTIYNHFGDKSALFLAVILESSERVAAAHVALIDRHLGGQISDLADLESQLINLGIALDAPVPEHAEHWSLMRHLRADLEHLPDTAVQTWRRNGPDRTLRELAHHLRRLADLGLLQLQAADHAAELLNRLWSKQERGESSMSQLEWTSASVHLFLFGFGATEGGDSRRRS